MVTSELGARGDERREYLRALEQGTSLVESLLEGRIQTEDFFQRYGDFYYVFALHGDEASEEQRQVIEEHAELCKLHEEIQRIAYLVYHADAPVPTYETAGRMLPERARQAIIDAAKDAGGLSRLVASVRDELR
jgi:hypothetical protein